MHMYGGGRFGLLYSTASGNVVKQHLQHRWLTNVAAVTSLPRYTDLLQGRRTTLLLMSIRCNASAAATSKDPLPSLTENPGHKIEAALSELDKSSTDIVQAFQRTTHFAGGDQQRMQAEFRRCVADILPLVSKMTLREVHHVLRALAAVRWFDGALMERLTARAGGLIREMPRGKDAVGLADLADLLVPLAHLSSGPVHLPIELPDGTSPGDLIEVAPWKDEKPLRVPVPYGAHLHGSFVYEVPAVLHSDLAAAVLKCACRIERKHATAFDICKLSWAAVVLRRPELAQPLVLGLTPKDFERMHDDKRAAGFTMLQQWLLGCRLAEAAVTDHLISTVLPPKMQWLERAAQQTFREQSKQLEVRSAKHDSAFQRGVTNAALKAQGSGFLLDVFAIAGVDGGCGLNRRPKREHVLDSGLSVDCAFPEALVAIEVDGPVHFFWNAPDRPLAKTSLKHELLRAEGWLVAAITSAEWQRLERPGDKPKLILHKIQTEEQRTKHSQSSRFEDKRKERKQAFMQLPDPQLRFTDSAGCVVDELVPTASSSSADAVEEFATSIGMPQSPEKKPAKTPEQQRAEQIEAARREHIDEKERAKYEMKKQERIRMRKLSQVERKRHNAAKQKREAEILAQREILEANFETSLQRDYSWVSACLSTPLEHDGVRVHVLGVNSTHPDCASQLWEVAEAVGWENASIVYGCTREQFYEQEKSGMWYGSRKFVDEQVKARREAAGRTQRQARKQTGPRQRRRTQHPRSRKSQPTHFWCCAPASLPSGGDSFSAKAYASSKGQQTEEAQQLRKMDEYQMEQRLNDAQRVYQQWKEQHGDAEASPKSLLRHVQDGVQDHRTLAADGIHVDSDAKSHEKCVLHNILQLVAEGQSLEESKRHYEHSAPAITGLAAVAGHIAAAVLEVIIPATKLRKEPSAGGTTDAPALVIVLPEQIYHEFRQAWSFMQADTVPSASILQELIDVGVWPHINTLERLKPFKKQMASAMANKDVGMSVGQVG